MSLFKDRVILTNITSSGAKQLALGFQIFTANVMICILKSSNLNIFLRLKILRADLNLPFVVTKEKYILIIKKCIDVNFKYTKNL